VPFEGYGGFSFSPVSVQKNAPALPGVYGLSNAKERIYVGAAGNIQAALIAHLRETNSTLKSLRPTGFTFELCEPGRHHDRESRLVTELSPACNRR